MPFCNWDHTASSLVPKLPSTRLLKAAHEKPLSRHGDCWGVFKNHLAATSDQGKRLLISLLRVSSAKSNIETLVTHYMPSWTARLNWDHPILSNCCPTARWHKFANANEVWSVIQSTCKAKLFLQYWKGCSVQVSACWLGLKKADSRFWAGHFEVSSQADKLSLQPWASQTPRLKSWGTHL